MEDTTYKLRELLAGGKKLLAEHRMGCGNFLHIPQLDCLTCDALIKHCASILEMLPPEPFFIRADQAPKWLRSAEPLKRKLNLIPGGSFDHPIENDPDGGPEDYE